MTTTGNHNDKALLAMVVTGKLIKRQRLPKNDVGDHWTWKDLNNGVSATFYGRTFHIYNMDNWSMVNNHP